MLARPSFLAEKVAPSASENISLAISRTRRPDCPGSRCWMNQAFSANRHASRNRGRSWWSQTARTPRRFSSETGWPPPALLVTVTITKGMRSRPSDEISRSSAVTSMFPLKGWIARGCLPSSITRSRARAPLCSTLALVVSKWLLFGTASPAPTVSTQRMRSAARP